MEPSMKFLGFPVFFLLRVALLSKVRLSQLDCGRGTLVEYLLVYNGNGLCRLARRRGFLC